MSMNGNAEICHLLNRLKKILCFHEARGPTADYTQLR